MNCQQIQRLLLESDEGRLPASAQEHLDACAGCRQAQARAKALCQLVGLKRHEKPAPGAAEQCAADVIRQLRSETPAGESLWERLHEWVAWPEAGFRVAVAAAAVLCAITGLFFAVQRPSSTPSDSLLTDKSTNLTTDLELPANQMMEKMSTSTNVDPTRIEYGTEPSRVVDFEK